jgi:hypothetical protein
MRRNYAAAFDAAAHPAVLAQLRARNESLLLVGTLRPDAKPLPVPTPLQPHVRTVADLNYKVGCVCWGCAAQPWGWRRAGSCMLGGSGGGAGRLPAHSSRQAWPAVWLVGGSLGMPQSSPAGGGAPLHCCC